MDEQANTYINLDGYIVNSAYTADFGSNDPLSLTTGNTSLGEFKLQLSANQTSVMDPYIKYFYDVAITDTSTLYRTRVLQGTIKVNAGVV